MSNNLQANLGYIIRTNYDSFSHCHLAETFLAIHASSKRVKVQAKQFLNLIGDTDECENTSYCDDATASIKHVTE